MNSATQTSAERNQRAGRETPQRRGVFTMHELKNQMPKHHCRGVVLAAMLLFSALAWAQAPAAEPVVPRTLNYAGVARDADGRVLKGTIGATFAIYAQQEGGAPLWLETQNILASPSGSFSVLLGANAPAGLPLDLFSSGQARWLGVSFNGGAEQARVALLSVPYALKAADAETVGGLPASAFVLASSPAPGTGPMPIAQTDSAPVGATVAPTASSNVTTTGGTVNAIPLFSTATNIQNSILTQTGTAAVNVAGKLNLPANGVATAAAGKNSRPLDFVASSFNSSSSTSVNQAFQWQAEPAANNSANPSGTLDLLFGSGTAAPAETGLKIASTGIITFATGQTFGGSGPITSVGLSAPTADFSVSGSPVTSAGILGLTWKVAPTSLATANAIVKRDSKGGFSADDINATVVNTGTLIATGNATFQKQVGIGTSSPQASLNLNAGETANSDTLLVGNNSTKGIRLRDTGTAVDLESIGVPLFVNYLTAEPTYFGNTVGIGTTAPQALLNLNVGGTATTDTLLVGNSTTKGLLLRDTGSALDLESIGQPLYINNTTKQPTYLNPSGGEVVIGSNSNTYQGLTTLDLWPTAGSSAVFEGSAEVLTNLTVLGTLAVDTDLEVYGVKNFRIDHPLDPNGKYLVHAAMESSEVLNQYSGNVVLDSKGEARVEFPDWFSAVNEDFRYQLTAVGQPGPNLFVAEKMRGNAFKIGGGRPGMEVSWQVTARRNDAYMKAYPFVVEPEKPENERGYYRHPELYGAPKEKGVAWARQHASTATKAQIPAR